jgi:hypothetical protein
MRLTFDESEGGLWFTPCRFDGTLQDSKHPFLGTPIKTPRNGTLTPEEQGAVEKVIAPARTSIENILKVADGGTAEVDVGPSSLFIQPRSVRPTVGLATVVYDALAAGNWCLRADGVLVVTDPANARQLPQRHPEVPEPFYEVWPAEVVVIESAPAMAKALGWGT